MTSAVIHRAGDLRPETRVALEAELGRTLREDEQVSIMAFSAHPALNEAQHRELVLRMERHFEDADEKTKGIPEDEWEEILLEAIRSVRPGYRER
jgi:hypothetical protein